MQVESALAGARCCGQGGLGPDRAALKDLGVIHEDELDHARKRNVHSGPHISIAVCAGLTSLHVLPRQGPDGSPQRHT